MAFHLRQKLLCTAALVTTFGGIPAAFAQPAGGGAAASSGLEEIVVTARRREENLQKVPVAVTAFSAKDIDNQAIKSLNDVAFQTPSLSLANDAGDPSGVLISMRGQVQNDIIPALEPSVGIYVDDVYYGQTVGTNVAHPFDLAQIEVLKGPQGTLYGRNTTGGAVKLTSKEPVYQYEGAVRVGLGSFNRLETDGMANIPIVDGKVALRVVAQYIRSDGFGRDVTHDRPLMDEHTHSFRANLRLDPMDNLKINLRGEYTDLRSGGGLFKPIFFPSSGTAAVEAAAENAAATGNLTGLGAIFAVAAFGQGLGPLPSNAQFAAFAAAEAAVAPSIAAQLGGDPFQVQTDAATPNFAHTQLYGGSLTAAYEFSDNLTLKSISALRRIRANNAEDLDGTSFTLLTARQEDISNQFTQELQLIGTGLDRKLNYTAGAYYFNRSATYFSNSDTLGILGALGNPSLAHSFISRSSPAVYGQVTYAVIPTVHLTGGLRWTQESFDIINNSTSGAGGVCTPASTNVPASTDPDGNCTTGDISQTSHNFSYTAGVDWNVTNDVMLYGKTSRGFKSGGINERISSVEGSQAPFLPEVVTDFEGGIKSTWLNNRVRLNADYYHSIYTNFQTSVILSAPSGALYTVTQNAQHATIDGVEAELTVVPVENLTVHTTAAWTEPKFQRFLVPADFSSERFENTPRWTYSVSAQYIVPLNVGPLRLQADYSWRSSADLYPADGPGINTTDGTPNRVQKAYGLLNAEIGLTIDAWDADIQIFGKNLTDERYNQSVLGLSLLGLASAIPGAPFTFGVDLNKRF